MHLDTLLCQQLLEADLLQSADNIGVYLPIRSEPDLSACYAQWRAQGRRLALPVVTGKNEPLTFRVWEAGALLRTAAFGVQVPETDETVVPDVLVIPCVGFRVLDGRPYRLGYGGGFYDRTLALPAFRTGRLRPSRCTGLSVARAPQGAAVSFLPHRPIFAVF